MTEEDGAEQDSGQDQSPSDRLNVGQKTGVALLLFALLAGLAWKTMEPGTLRTLVMVVLGGLALRLLLGLRRLGKNL